jgi:putative addiction module killer protein
VFHICYTIIMETFKIVIYEAKNKKSPFTKWFDSLDAPIQRTIAVRFDRVSVGNFGDSEQLREGVWELKIHSGPGYRIYFGKEGKTLIIILTGGLKKSQKKDIEKAIEYWNEYKERYG